MEWLSCFVDNGPNIARFYEHFIHDSHNIKKVFNLQTEHCMVYIAIHYVAVQ